MQSWPQGQNGGDDNSSWQQGFDFAPQNGQYAQGQGWSQPVQDSNAFARHMNPSDPAATFLQDPHAMLSGYQESHGHFDLNQQFSNGNVIDPAFGDIHPDLYAQPSKIDLDGGNMHHMNSVQGHQTGHSQGHPQSHPQGYGNQDYASFDSQTRSHQHFGPSTPQYSQAQLAQQPSRQQSHTPIQQFENVPSGFAQAQIRQNQLSPAPQQQPYGQSNAFAPPPVNGQSAHYQPNQNIHLDYQQSSAAFSQAYPTPKSFDYQTPAGSQHAFQSQSAQHVDPHLTQAASGASIQSRSTPQPQPESPFDQPAAGEGPARKRQRMTKEATDSPVPESASMVNNTIDLSSKKVEELDILVPPKPNDEEAQMLQQFQKRTKAAQAKFPSITGLPHLAYESTIRLPAPKSYDKLVPLVAAPSRSGKPIIPELGHDLPCEVQGKFTSQYRPAFDRIGLDERRLEAKPLLDAFDASMKSFGKRRPKYTEYPHAFKEQLKSDEANKNKAEKKAKKEQEGEKNKPIRSPIRPSDPVEAAAWDAIGIVHNDSNVNKSSTSVAVRVQQAGDLFIKLRTEMNQAKQDVDQATKENKPEAEIAQLRKVAEAKKDALHRALDATIEHADDSIMDNLGGHQKLILSLVNALIACIKAGDFSGKLPKVVLELFTHFPMTKKIAETQSFDTVRKRFLDKGDDEVKDLVREISAKVKKTLKAAESDVSTGYQGTSAASRAKTSASKTGAASKRGRDDDTTDGRTVKKVAVDSGSSSLSKKLAQPKLQLQSASKTTAAKAAASSILGDKMRAPVKSAPKSEAIGAESSTSPADDRNRLDGKKAPVKIEAAKIAPSKAENKPPAPKMGAPPTSGALSGIASLLDSINSNRPDTPPSAPKEVKGPEVPETEAEKAKRLRKESRRKLRVTWRPENELVQVKIFEKEDEEDEGRDMNMIRDAADDKSEGMVLKQRADVEDDDDDDDIPYQPWMAPVALDFSALAEDARKKNFTSRGGNVAFSTDEQERIRQREQRELMAIYADPADIPVSPKSPPPEAAHAGGVKAGHLLPEDAKYQEIHTRWREEQQMGLDGALYAATQRLGAKTNPANALDSILGRLQDGSAQAQSSKPTPINKITLGGTETNVPLVLGPELVGQVLAWLQSEKAKKWQDPNPSHSDPSRAYNYSDATAQNVGPIIEALAQSLADKPYPATSPPDWLAQDAERVREWWVGYNKEAAVRLRRAEEERVQAEAEAQRTAIAAGQPQNPMQDWMAYFAQQQQQQQQDPQAPNPYMAILQQMTGGQPQAAAPTQTQMPDSQMQAILAAMGQPQQQQTLASGDSVYHPNDPSYQQLMMLTQMAEGQQPQPQPQASSADQDHGRDRDRDDWDRHDRDRRFDRHDDYGRGSTYRDRDRDSKKKKPGPSTIHKPPNAALIGTKPCTFWQQGKCARGDKCTFRHD